jgi:5-methylcytosine-specific restriction endonuclease McrA
MSARYLCLERGGGCHFYADRVEPGVGPICARCYRRLHPVYTARPAGSRGAPRHVRRRVLTRDGQRCQLTYDGCLGEATEVDHRIGVAAVLRAGGTRQQADDPSNLQSACSHCHAIKTERERSEASAAANRKRVALRRERLRRPVEKHPGDD